MQVQGRPSAGPAVENRHAVRLEEENASMGNCLQDWEEPISAVARGQEGGHSWQEELGPMMGVSGFI